jgi:hypothetical protein
MSSLLKQLLSQRELIPPEVEIVYEKTLPKAERVYLSDLTIVAGTLSSHFSSAYVLLDGLDECEAKLIAEIVSREKSERNAL